VSSERISYLAQAVTWLQTAEHAAGRAASALVGATAVAATDNLPVVEQEADIKCVQTAHEYAYDMSVLRGEVERKLREALGVPA
jgi:hypothetical protein